MPAALHAEPSILSDGRHAVLISLDGLPRVAHSVATASEAEAWTLAARLLWTGWSEGARSGGPWPEAPRTECIDIELDEASQAALDVLVERKVEVSDAAPAPLIEACGGDRAAAKRCALEAVLYEALLNEIAA